MTISTAMVPSIPASAPPSPLTPEGRAWRGFAIGIGLAAVLTTLSVARGRWGELLILPVLNLIWLPCLLGGLGYCGIRRRPDGPLPWRRTLTALAIFIAASSAGAMILAMAVGLPPGWTRGVPRFAAELVSSPFCLFPAMVVFLARWVELPPAREWPRGRPRLHVRTLLALVAYVALLFGVGIATEPIGRTAMNSYHKMTNAESMVSIFRVQMARSEREAALRLDNAARLRRGEIPEGLYEGQAAFLRSLDATATPEFRKYRRGLIEDGHEQAGQREARNVVVFQGLIDHYEGLAAKYRRAMRRPWLPIEPDPPLPPNQ